MDKVAKINEIAIILCETTTKETDSSQKLGWQGLVAHRLRDHECMNEAAHCDK